MIRSTLALTLFFAFSLQLKYNVVAPGASSVSVNIGGTLTEMSRKWNGVPYFVASVDSATYDDIYKYVADGTAEPFDRIWPVCKPSSTYNDFFGREQTIQKLDKLGSSFPQWNRSAGANGVFNDDYISTVFIVGDKSTETWFMEVYNSSNWNNISIALISRDDEKFWNQSVKVHIEDTSALKPKIKLSLPKNYQGRDSYKLRPSAEDPVMMRDKLYNDILGAIGCPHSESSFTRLYVNDIGVGLYNLQESPSTKDFITTQFYGNGTEPDPVGVYFDCATGADFENYNDNAIYSFIPSKKNQGTNYLIQNLIDALNAVDLRDDSSIDQFSKLWFDVDYFFRAIAVEYLSGSYDSYWFQTTNFVLYNEVWESSATNKKFYFIDQDFDQTFGINLGPTYNPYGVNYTSIPYTNYVNKTWNVVPYDAPHRVMVDKLLSNPTYKAKFENILKTIVTEVFNPVALGIRIDSISSRIRPEMVWDYGLGASRAHQGRYPVIPHNFSIADYDAGFTAPAVDALTPTWGLKTWVSLRADAVSEFFGGITYTSTVIPPGQCKTGDNKDNTATTSTGSSTDSSSPSASSTGQSTSGSAVTNSPGSDVTNSATTIVRFGMAYFVVIFSIIKLFI